MGEIADAFLSGAMCEWCGVYLGEDGFHTRLCGGCSREKRKKDRKEKEKNDE